MDGWARKGLGVLLFQKRILQRNAQRTLLVTHLLLPTKVTPLNIMSLATKKQNRYHIRLEALLSHLAASV